jgi:drug/metabolite transporter (DMT)-like permease
VKPKDLLALILLGALWGGSFLFIRVAAPVLGPLVLIKLRVGVAATVLALYAVVVARHALRSGSPSGWQAVFHRTAIPMSCKSYPSSRATSMVRNDE